MGDTLRIMKFIRCAAICLFFVAYLALDASCSQAAPRGAIKIASIVVFQSGETHCGFTKGQFVPGRILQGKFFYPRAAERSNLMIAIRSASGKKKKKLQTDAVVLLAKLKTEKTDLCCRPSSSYRNASTDANRNAILDLVSDRTTDNNRNAHSDDCFESDIQQFVLH